MLTSLAQGNGFMLYLRLYEEYYYFFINIIGAGTRLFGQELGLFPKGTTSEKNNVDNLSKVFWVCSNIYH